MKKLIKKVLIGMSVIALQPWNYLSGGFETEVYAKVNNSSEIDASQRAQMKITEKTKQSEDEDCCDGALPLIQTNYDTDKLVTVNYKVTDEKKGKDSLQKIYDGELYAEGSKTYQEILGPTADEQYYYGNYKTDSTERAVYDKIVATILGPGGLSDVRADSIQTGIVTIFDTPIEETVNIQDIVESIRSDHPEWYWFDDVFNVSSDRKEITIFVSANYSSNSIRSIVESDLIKLVQEFETSEITAEDTPYDIVVKIHDFIIKNAYYNKDATNAHNVLGVLINHEGVCDSYAKASQLLFNYFGITNAYVTGKEQLANGKLGSGHAWNQIYISRGSDKPMWVNYDATWDDLDKDRDSAADDNTETEGITYLYFCRDDYQFAHLTGFGGKYKADRTVNTCGNDKYNYFATHSCLYLSKNNTTTDVMATVKQQIDAKIVLPIDGYYQFRFGYDVSYKIDDLVKSLISKTNHIVYAEYSGIEGDVLIKFKDDRYYDLINTTDPSEGGTLYCTLSDYTSVPKVEWGKTAKCTRPISQNTFYILTKGNNRVEEITYKIGLSGTEQKATISKCLEQVILPGETHLYKCTLPITPAEGQAVYISVKYTTSKMAKLAFQEDEYIADYGTPLTLLLDIKPDDSKEAPTGSVTYYKDEIKDKNIIRGQEAVAISGGTANATINSRQADLPAGTYNIYAVYQGDDNYKSKQIAATKVTINKLKLEYSLEKKYSKEYGKPESINGTYTIPDGELPYGETLDTINKTDPEVTANTTESSDVGTYNVKVIREGEAPNYNIVTKLNNATLEVTKAVPKITLTANTNEAVNGETVQFKVTVANPHMETLKTSLPSADNILLYLGSTKVGTFSRTSEEGVYICDYTVLNGADKTLSFTAKTANVIFKNYSAGESSKYDISVETSKYLISFYNEKGDAPVSQRLRAGEKIQQPADPEDPAKESEFIGWYLGKNSNQRWSFDSNTVKESMTLYARWKTATLQEISGIVLEPYTDYEYDATAHDAVTIKAGTVSGDSYEYTLNGITSTEVPQIKDAGTYQLKVVVKRDWCKPYEKSIDLVIKQATPTIQASLDTEVKKSYTGRPVEMDGILVTGINGESVSNDHLKYVYYTDKYLTIKTTTADGAVSEGSAPTKSGEYYVKVIFTAAGNYGDASGKCKMLIQQGIILELSDLRAEVASNQADNYEYDLSSFLSTEYNFGNVTYTVGTVKDDDHILSGKPTVTANGTLKYKVVSTDAGKVAEVPITIRSENYKPVNVLLIIAVMDKKAVTITGITTPDISYNGKPYEYQGKVVVQITTGNAVTVNLEKKYVGKNKNNEEYSSETAPTDAGDYKLILSVPKSDRQYTGSAEFAFSIKPQDLIIKADDLKINVGDNAPPYTTTTTGLAENDTVQNVTITCSYIKNDPTKGIPGAYDIVPAGGTVTKAYNYNISYQKGTLTVKALHTVTFKCNVNGATNPQSISASEGTKVTMPVNTAVRDGYTFEGWIGPDTKTYRTGEQYTMIDEDVVFSASWKRKTALSRIDAKYTGDRLPMGSTIPLDQIKVTAYYTNDTTEVITDFRLSAATVEKEGDNVITVTYGSMSSDIVIQAYKNSVVSVSATYKGTVLVGQKIDRGNLTVTATYEDGKTETITTGYTYNDTTITLGTNKFTLTYSEKTTTFEVLGVPAEGSAVLTFDSQGGSTVNKAVVDVGKTYNVETPTRFGYVFNGWFTKTGGQGSQLTSSTVITGSATYYAYWTEGVGHVSKIYATYHGELFSGQLKSSDFVVMAVYDNGTRGLIDGFTLSTSSLRVGTNKIIVTYESATTIVTINVPDRPRSLAVTVKETVYAVDYVLKNSDMTVIATLVDGTTKEITDFTLSNNTIKEGTTTVEVSYNGTTAKVDVQGKQSYTVKFNSKGGTKVDSVQVISGKMIGTLKKPTKDHYTFEGWYFDTSYNQKCTSSNKITNDVTLYAKWKEIKLYEISDKYINVAVLGQDSVSISGAEGVQWVSDDLNIASVDRDGIITGLNKGTVVITGYTTDGYELECIVTVGKEVQKINVSKTKVTIKKGNTYQLKATVSPSNAVTKTLEYSSTDESVATVNQKGRILPRNKGTCYIVIRTTDSSNLTKKVKITVK